MEPPVSVPSILRSGSVPRGNSATASGSPEGSLRAGSGDSHALVSIPNRVRPLAALCARILVDTITDGFNGIGTRVTGLSGLPYTSVDARAFFFSREASKILERLDRDGVLAKYVLQQTVPPSTALYCACATLYCISSYEVAPVSSLGSVLNRMLELSIVKCAGACWSNLRKLTFVGCAIDKEFLEILGSGKARKTLESLDFSSTFVDDDCLEALEPFTALTQLELNGCPEITVAGLRTIVRCCPGLRILGLTNNEIGLPGVVETLTGPSAPLPHLRELRMEVDGWGRYLPYLLQFCTNRVHVDRLKIWSVIPKLEYPDKQCCQELITKGPWRKVHVRYDSLDLLAGLPQLRYLQLQIAEINQNTVNKIASICPRLETLLLTSTRFDSAGVDLSVLNRIQDLALPDAYLGRIIALPRRTRSLTVTIMAIDNHEVADAFMNAVLDCRHLRKLHLLTSQSEFKTASFTSESFRGILEHLRLLEDIAIDRDMFGRERLAAEFVIVIPVNHPKLLSFRIISTFVRTFLPFIEYAPSLLSFSATNHLESIASLEALSLFSPNLRNLQLKFDRAELMEAERLETDASPRDDSSVRFPSFRPTLSRKRSNSVNDVKKIIQPLPAQLPAPRQRTSREFSPRSNTPRKVADLISDCFSRLRSLSYVSLYGATEKLTSRLRQLHLLHRLTLSYCNLSNEALNQLVQDIPSLRKLEIERCNNIKSLAGMKSKKLAKFDISSCNQLHDALEFTPDNLPALEIISVTQLQHVRSITVRDLPELRWATFSRISGAKSIIICDVPRLVDLALESITTVKLLVVAPQLHRLFLDCSRTFSSSLSSESVEPGSDVAVSFKMPELRKLSWQADDTEIDELVSTLKETPKISTLELPAYSVEDLEPLSDLIRQHCPRVKVVGCGDGDLPLYEASVPHTARS